MYRPSIKNYQSYAQDKTIGFASALRIHLYKESLKHKHDERQRSNQAIPKLSLGNNRK